MKTGENKNSIKGVALLLTTALIWGSSFVAQSLGMEKIEAFTFNGIRTLIGGFALIPVILVKSRITKAPLKASLNKDAIKRGLLLGLVFFAASNLQQFAFIDSTSGKIAFITSLYMFFVPLLGLFLGKRVPLLTWLCVVLGFIGLYFLCIRPDQPTAINRGDFLAFLCSFFFAIHILLVERFSVKTDGTVLSCLQFFVSGTISVICMFIFESPDIDAILSATQPLLYSGLMSCGVAYTFQIIGQKYTEATLASLLMCMESVFAVITAAIILGERMSAREAIGCIIMFAAIIISQISGARKSKSSQT
ncbi:MAG: DMT family transporter [Lachnospiraceae bacterium]|nr:DMT family transporter [Lachnospiraceae bacterium]